MGPVEIAFLNDCAVVMVTPEGEGSGEFKEALSMALDKGYASLWDEYFDQQLDRYVYVFTPLEDQ